MFGGDDSMRDARKTASCYLLEAGLEEQVRDDRIATIKSAINHKINTFLNSSVGRLFDAVASILNLGQTNRYEGECASQLEREAVLAQKKGKKPIQLSFAFIEEHEIIKIDTKPLLEALCKLRDTEDIGALALGFHYALTEAIVKICEKLSEKYRTKTVALSGGVFQNTVLSELTLKELRNAGFQVYVNLAVPPNDGGISLGQTYLGLQSNIFLK